MISVLIEILGAIISLTIGGVASKTKITEYLDKAARKLLGEKATEKSYSERLSELTQSLNKSTDEVDRILSELTTVAQSREKAVSKLEKELTILEAREKETKKHIEELQKVPVEVADRFAQLTEAGEKRSAKRDYILFGLGVIVSTLIGIVLKILGLG